MFLKSLKIENNSKMIREIFFHKGINLIIDETKTSDKKESGNNVGKTTVLRLIDYCFGSDGKNIYRDTEFKSKANTQIELFLKQQNVIITLTLKEDLEDELSSEIVIRRNFLSYKEKTQEINGENFGNIKDFAHELKKLAFNSSEEKPTLRQIVAKNIRDEKNKLVNAIKVLHANTTLEEYEALYLFWLGIDLDGSDRKQKLLAQKKIEESLQNRLRRESTLSQIEQSLVVVNRAIEELSAKKDSFNINDKYEDDLVALNQAKFDINALSTELSRLELRRELIQESKRDLEKEISTIDKQQIRNLYEEAKALIPNIQKTFDDTLKFHNQMISEKLKYITSELPTLEEDIKTARRKTSTLLAKEKSLTDKLKKAGAIDELQQVISELNKVHEKRGSLEEQKRLWESSQNKLESIKTELDSLNAEIRSKDDLIKERITEFNKYFSDISYRLYGEQFVLSSDRNERGYELNISSISGNLGTGKKKVQIAAFDLAYIQFADALKIDALHFILQDQMENVHSNQISSLFTEIVSEVNCQYVLPVLRDKLPSDIDIEQYEVLSLSQSDKLFRLT